MSMTGIKPYFKERLENLNYREWEDGFNFENIPSNLLDRSFHIYVNFGNGVRLNMQAQEIDITVELRVFFKGYRNISEGIDRAIEGIEDIIVEVVKSENRLENNNTFKNVLLNGFFINPLNNTNDNSILVDSTFTVTTILDVDNCG